ncbi:MAG: hypothetical protein ACLT98_02050 [Eggerthellaceae bacterium]
MMRVMAKKPDDNPLLGGNVAAGCGVRVRRRRALCSMTKGVRPEMEGNLLKRKMLLRHATSPGSMDVATV